MFFRHVESIGMDQKNIKSFTVKHAEGELGTILTVKKIHRITKIPADSVFLFPTSFGRFVPREIISIPIIGEGNVVALITLASVKDFNEISFKWLNEILITLTAKFNGVIAFKKISDISERLAQSYAYNRSLIEANFDPLVTIGRDGKITDVNNATEVITGLQRKQLIGTDFSNYFTEPEVAMAGYEKVFFEGTVKDYELILKNINGSTTPVLYNASVYKDQKGEVIGVFAAARDITQLKITELKLIEQNQILEQQSEELQAQTEELQLQTDELHNTSEELHKQNLLISAKSAEVEEANRLKSEFLSNMSHELRTPLNSIMALSNVLLRQSKTKLNEDENNYLEIIERNGKNLLKLINDILDLSKVEAGKIDLSVKSVDVRKLMENIIDSLSPIAEKKGLKISLSIPSDFPFIATDESRFQQIITNILGNAVKFTEKGSIDVFVGCDSNIIWIEVKDTGIGIPNEELPYIFDKFRQVDGSSSRSFEGTGLGLSIVHELLKIIGGEIKVKSEFGVGSVFKIVLPVEWKGEISNSDKPSLRESPIIAKKNTILIIDDDPVAIMQLRSFVEEIAYNAVSTTMAREALSMAEVYKPFAITLDVIMPGLDGWEILQRLKNNEKTKSIPVIIVSVSCEKETGFVLGAVGHITKPVEKEKLLSEIKRLHKNARDIIIADDSEIDIEISTSILDREGINVIKVNRGEQCIELLKIKKPDILILDLMMPEVNGFHVLDFVRKNQETKNLPVIIVTAKDLTENEKAFLSGKVSSIIQKNETRANDVFVEINRIIKELEKNNSGHALAPKTYKRNILIVEDNNIAIIQIKDLLESGGFEVDIAIGGEQALVHIKNKIPDGIILDLMMPEVDGFQVIDVLQNDEKTADIPILILTAMDLTKQDCQRLNSSNVHYMVQKGSINVNNLLDKINNMTLKHSAALDKTDHTESTSKFDIRELKVVDKNRKFKILIIEDNPDNMTTIKAILGNTYEFTEAFDGLAGLKQANSGNHDIILLDLSLPKMSGMEVFRNIKLNNNTKHIPVVAVTAKAMRQDKNEIEKAGFDGYIIKPIDEKILKDQIGILLRNSND
jgi:PAS domain S-box-containing protein